MAETKMLRLCVVSGLQPTSMAINKILRIIIILSLVCESDILIYTSQTDVDRQCSVDY